MWHTHPYKVAGCITFLCHSIARESSASQSAPISSRRSICSTRCRLPRVVILPHYNSRYGNLLFFPRMCEKKLPLTEILRGDWKPWQRKAKKLPILGNNCNSVLKDSIRFLVVSKVAKKQWNSDPCYEKILLSCEYCFRKKYSCSAIDLWTSSWKRAASQSVEMT